jgi:hypothetical protein
MEGNKGEETLLVIYCLSKFVLKRGKTTYQEKSDWLQ